MMKYEEVIQKLEKIDTFAVSKLSIYHELRSKILEENLTEKEIEKLIEYIFEIYINDNWVWRSASQCALAVLGLQETLREVLHMQVDSLSEKLEKQISIYD